MKHTNKQLFRERFPDADIIVFAPGRVNIIGEHTDYNGGNVLPAALDMGTYLAVTKRDDNIVRAFSVNFNENVEFTLDNLPDTKKWYRYIAGALQALKELYNITLPSGFDMVVEGDIPDGAGLSSSASFGVGIITALNRLFNLGLTPVETALAAQKTEHLTGVNCGIMDQFASAMGKKDHGILLNCNTLEYKYVPMNLGDYTLVIMDSQKKRQLHESKYNERRAECERALSLLQQELDVQSLGEISEEQFELCKHLIEDPIILKRARHAVTENQRTLKAMECLQRNDTAELGRLLNESHYSLRDDYEVTGFELDSLTEAARSYPGVLGARMTGAGFGGCCIALVPSDSVDDFIAKTGEIYHKQTGLTANFYITTIEDGAA